MDRRLLSLPKLKRDKGAVDAHPIYGMDDLQICDAVSGLVAEEARKNAMTNLRQIRNERMRLMPGLRPWATPSPGAGSALSDEAEASAG